jgi:ABC-type multidrug transport system permease subunit
VFDHFCSVLFHRYIGVSLFFGSVFYQIPTGSEPSDYTNRTSVLFFALFSLLMNHQEDISGLIEDRAIYYRERASCVYSPFSYWISKLIIAIPFNLVNLLLFSVILYNLVGLRTTNNAFANFLMITWLTSFISLFTCQFLAFISSSTEMAMSLFPIVLFFATAFEGYIVFLPKFPSWLSWIANISYMRFAFQSLTLNEFQGNEQDLPLEQPYINALGFNTLSMVECSYFLFIFLFAHGIASYLALYFINYEKR